MIVLIFIFLSRKWTKNLASRYEKNNATPSDYTLYFYIHPGINKDFDKIFYDPELPGSSRGQQFREYIRKQVLVIDKKVEIVRIDLAFDNRRMIKLLKKRGHAIKNSNSGEIFLIEHLINQEKEKQYYRNICGVFITFSRAEDAKETQRRCLEAKA